jgi:hypothetical protein
MKWLLSVDVVGFQMDMVIKPSSFTVAWSRGIPTADEMKNVRGVASQCSAERV